jgi:hypothetical protein
MGKGTLPICNVFWVWKNTTSNSRQVYMDCCIFPFSLLMILYKVFIFYKEKVIKLLDGQTPVLMCNMLEQIIGFVKRSKWQPEWDFLLLCYYKFEWSLAMLLQWSCLSSLCTTWIILCWHGAAITLILYMADHQIQGLAYKICNTKSPWVLRISPYFS